MNTNCWGPGAWNFLHAISFNYPDQPSEKDKQDHITLFTHLQNILPCPTCRDEYAKMLSQFPVKDAVHSKEALTRWLVDIHNRVNKRLNKPHMPFDQVKERYESMRGKCSITTTQKVEKKNQCVLYIIIFLIIIICILVWNNRKCVF